LTMPEIANILHGMSNYRKVHCSATVQCFTDRLLYLHIKHSEKASPREAANVLLALGRMEIRDERVFEVMSTDMLDQLDVASAQAIANALWAYRTVHIPPPRQLLDRWAMQRLGLNTVQTRKKPGARKLRP